MFALGEWGACESIAITKSIKLGVGRERGEKRGGVKKRKKRSRT